jgi:hypothetical protein
MTDRELLELAAKAAGLKILRDPSGMVRNCTGMDPAMNIFAAPKWNPLADDGDALRLAVKLGLNVTVMQPRDRFELGRTGVNEMWNLHNADPYAATRRAIVRAAAEIGKG